MRKFILFLLALPVLHSFAQTGKADPRPFIEVTGTALKEVVPDQIFISITLSDKVVNNEKYTIESQEEKLKRSLQKIDIDLGNLVLTNATSEITRNKSKETGFKVAKEYTLRVKNSDEVSKVFKELYAINIKESYITRTEHSQIDSLRKVVRVAAIQAAKDKAEYLLAAIGEKIDKPLEVREQAEQPYYSSNVANVVQRTFSDEDDEGNKAQIAFQKLSIRFSYYIKYSIK